jgi:hypothetical protein
MWIYWSAFAVVMAWVFGASVVWALDVLPTHAENVVAVVSLGLVCIIQAIALCIAGRRIWEQKQQQQNAAQYARRPPNEPQIKTAAVDTTAAQPPTPNEQHQAKEELFWDRQIETAKGLNYITLGAAAVAILGLFFINRSIQHTDQGNIDANRGWIAMDSMAATGEIGGDKNIDLQIYFLNVGRSPALKLGSYFWFDSTPNVDKSESVALVIGPNHTCDSATILPDGPTIFQNPKPEWISTTFPRKSIPIATLSNDRALYVQGCLIYETMHETHHTWFCFLAYRNGKFATASATVTCKDGHGAD